MDREIKKCPIFNMDCLKEECEMWNEKIGTCNINMISYNTFKLFKNIEESLNLFERLNQNLEELEVRVKQLTLSIRGLT